MSKSYNNTISIFDTDKKIRKQIMKIITDATEINQPKDKETPLFQIFCLFLNDKEIANLSDRYENAGIRYGDIKQELYEKVMDYFALFRKKREDLISRPDLVHDILKTGAIKAQIVAMEVLDRVRSATGIKYL